MHSFFAYKNTSGLVCITNGLIADPSVNCDQAYDFGKEPVSLFKAGQMRPAENKAKLGDCFSKDVQYIDHVDGIPSYIIDGGYLLHKFI